MYDDVYVRRVTADENAASNGLVSNAVSIRVHKVVVTGDGSNAVSVDIHDDSNASNAALIKISVASNERFAGEFSRFTQANFSPPVSFNTGVSFNLTGNTAVVYLYFTR